MYRYGLGHDLHQHLLYNFYYIIFVWERMHGDLNSVAGTGVDAFTWSTFGSSVFIYRWRWATVLFPVALGFCFFFFFFVPYLPLSICKES